MSDNASGSIPPSAELARWLEHAQSLHSRVIDMGLERLREVATRMHAGRGVRFACPVFSVAGTNGKGSTCAMLESALRCGGWRTGLFTSPHLVHFAQRCRIDGRDASAEALCAHMAAVEAARGDVPLTFFEFTTLAILDLLAQSSLDAVVLEVGLGGRLDAVNLIDADCAIITPIAIDHVEHLGSEREAIGREKAGIMRAGKPAIVSDPHAPRSLIEHAQAIGADLWLPGRDFSVRTHAQQWSWTGRGRCYGGLAHPALRGAHQIANAAGVLAALRAMRGRLMLSAQALRQGLASADLPGRLQVLPGQPTLLLDVAHNPHSASALVAHIDAMPYAPRTHMVFGAMADKDVPEMLRLLHPVVDAWYFSDLPTPRAASAAQLQAMWRSCAAPLPRATQALASAYPDVRSALDAALGAAHAADRIVVAGSFCTVGAVLADPPQPSAMQRQAPNA